MKTFVLLILLGVISLPMSAADTPTESLVLGGGCFWCTDAAYKLLPGVTHVTCGYAGGDYPNPSYEDVCTGTTGHAEVIKIDYDPTKTSLEKLLEFFWHVHDPTQIGGQGNDEGPQYRSIILYANEAQRIAAEKSKAEAQKRFSDRITTAIVPLTKFWPAEDYHQDYFAKHPHRGYCALVIAPKVDKLKKLPEVQGK
ncbi:MAG TPA: peptide-methionine (S)-S-oxide reductase MsrA [Opitutaceae bacterium]|nr:peptide-methionine (S)-S-oxide reductase MsrA [Opitutaceae bacterium]